MDQMTLHSSQLFDADPASAAIVRRYVRESLDSLCLGSDEAVLLANELATNAILHAQSEFVVEVSVRERTCRIGVVDHDQRRPDKIEEVDHDATRGRGLALVQALSTSWGVEDRENGKAVWCDVTVAPL
jgi:anti-sigma regulatory factor (Ser/Thr protein kinase)